jgi:hypothetical protein
MSAAWIDRIGVATIVLLAGAYLARRAVRRVAAAFTRRPAAGACGPECGCGGDGALD